MSKYFFQPRIGEFYEEGFFGSKTMIVGAHHYCNRENCKYYEECVKKGKCKKFDKKCPWNIALMKKFDEKGTKYDKDYYTLSNSNEVEIESYLEECPYPAYSAFTKYMLGLRDYVDENRRRDFWNHVAFYNYTQHFLPNGYTPTYDTDKKLFDQDCATFMKVVKEYAPQVIYVWNPAVKDCIKNYIRKHKNSLDYKGRTDMQGLSVYLFTYECDNEYDISKLDVNNKDFDHKQLLKDIHYARHHECFVENLKKIGHDIWNRSLTCQLTDRIIKAEVKWTTETSKAFAKKIMDEKMPAKVNVYSSFYWEELENALHEKGMPNIKPLSLLPPPEYSWFDVCLNMDDETEPNVCAALLAADCDLLGGYVGQLIKSDKYQYLYFLSSTKHIDTYQKILFDSSNPIGVKSIGQIGELRDGMVLICMERGYRKHAEMYYEDNSAKDPYKGKYIPGNTGTLCPGRIGKKTSQQECKKVIESLIKTDILVLKNNEGKSVFLSQILSELTDRKHQVIYCTPSGFHRLKEKKITSYHLGYLRERLRAWQKKLTYERLEKLFPGESITKTKPKKVQEFPEIDKAFNELKIVLKDEKQK